MLSTPPAFILSQDQTLHKCLCAARATRNGMTVNDKFETDKNKPNRFKEPDWTCFVLFISISKGIPAIASIRPKALNSQTPGFLAFDIVHAVEFSRIGRSQFPPHGFYLGPTKLDVLPSLSRRATCLTYHCCFACQIGGCGPRAARHIDFSHSRGGSFILSCGDRFC